MSIVVLARLWGRVLQAPSWGVFRISEMGHLVAGHGKLPFARTPGGYRGLAWAHQLAWPTVRVSPCSGLLPGELTWWPEVGLPTQRQALGCFLSTWPTTSIV